MGLDTETGWLAVTRNESLNSRYTEFGNIHNHDANGTLKKRNRWLRDLTVPLRRMPTPQTLQNMMVKIIMRFTTVFVFRTDLKTLIFSGM